MEQKPLSRPLWRTCRASECATRRHRDSPKKEGPSCAIQMGRLAARSIGLPDHVPIVPLVSDELINVPRSNLAACPLSPSISVWVLPLWQPHKSKVLPLFQLRVCGRARSTMPYFKRSSSRGFDINASPNKNVGALNRQ